MTANPNTVEVARKALGPVGVFLLGPILNGPVPAARQREAVRQLEDAGYRAAWNNEIVYDKDAFVQLALMLANTEHMVFGTSIANIWARTPQVSGPADRKSFTIISGGVNIYPAEIESCLIMHPKVADVAVFGLPDPDIGEYVHAVVQPAAGVDPSDELADELREYARANLARYKTPRVVDFRAELPRRSPAGPPARRPAGPPANSTNASCETSISTRLRLRRVWSGRRR